VSSNRLFVLGGLLLAVALALFISPFADSDPDGLERVAGDQGFIERAQVHSLEDSPVAEYKVEGVDGEHLSTGLAGIIGVLITFGVGTVTFGAVKSLRPRNGSPPGKSPLRQ
jgi:hypothetical protein